MTGSNPWVSWVWPAVTHTARMIPWLSQTRWTLVLKPPRDRPSAWSGGSSSCVASGPPNCGGCAGLFFRAGGRGMGPVNGAIEAPEVALDDFGLVELEQQGVENLGPGAVLAPAVEAVVDGLPGAVASWRIGPRGTRVQVPEDAVDQGAMVLPGVAAAALVGAVGEEVLDPLPLGVGEVKAIVPGWPPSGNCPARLLRGRGITVVASTSPIMEVCNPSRVPAARPFSDACVTCKPRTSASAASSTRRPVPASARRPPSPRVSPPASQRSPVA